VEAQVPMTIGELHKESFPDFSESSSLMEILTAHGLTEKPHVLKSKQEVLHLARIVNKLSVRNLNLEEPTVVKELEVQQAPKALELPMLTSSAASKLLELCSPQEDAEEGELIEEV